MRMLYVIGAPGSGKTTALRHVLEPFSKEVINLPPKVTYYEAGALVQIGYDRGTFSGTDTLAMNAQPRILQALDDYRWDNVVAEGDRLANVGFFEGVRAIGYDLTVAYMDTPLAMAAERREMRGSDQNQSWVNGRITKAHRLAERCATVTLDGKPWSDVIARQLALQSVFNQAANVAAARQETQ